MLKYVKSSVAAAALVGVGLVSPAMAQSASEVAVRMQQLEEQVRQLTGQVEELSFQVKQLRAQGAAAPQQSGAAQPVKPAATIAAAPAPQPAAEEQPTQQKRLAAASAGAPIPDSNDVETIEQAPITSAPLAPLPAPAAQAAPAVQQDVPGGVPTSKVLGALDSASAQPGDGGFQGQVLVPPSQQEPGEDYVQQGSAAPAPATTDDNSIETVSLQPDAATQTESPESLYERSNESLLRRQFGDAEAGFSTFLSKYPDHSLAGSAQYWLGETYYAQNDYKRAAANFLQGYKKYPTSRRAPDSLLKLGISLNRLGQGEQACAAFSAVSAEYPKAVDARKRAQAEAKRAGCTS